MGFPSDSFFFLKKINNDTANTELGNAVLAIEFKEFSNPRSEQESQNIKEEIGIFADDLDDENNFEEMDTNNMIDDSVNNNLPTAKTLKPNLTLVNIIYHTAGFQSDF